MGYDTIIFDLYGTLVDVLTDESLPAVWEETSGFMTAMGAPITDEELKSRYFAILSEDVKSKGEFYEPDLYKTFKAIYGERGIVADKKLIDKTGVVFRKASTLLLKAYDGVLDGLKALRSAGKRIILLSNAQWVFTRYELELLNLNNAFDKTYISSCCGVKKPSKEFFMMPIKELSLDISRTVMVGNDGTCDVLGAQSVGLDTIYFKTATSPDKEMPPATYCFSKQDMKGALKIILK